MGDDNCPLCARALGRLTEDHHLIPKTFGGKELVRLHAICHRKIHSAITERELSKYYYTIPRILEHTEIKNFVAWVQRKDPDFYMDFKDSRDRKAKRRR